MLFIENLIVNKIKEGFYPLFNANIEDNLIQIQKTRKEFSGDFTVVVFPLLKISKQSPEQTGNILGEYLVNNTNEISNFNVIKGFLNLNISEKYWLNFAKFAYQEEKYGLNSKNESSKTYMIEYSSPNTNKPLHLGHIRNNLLGYSISNILKANGNKVIKVNLVNDRGIHICKSMLAWQKWGNGETPESTGRKGDHLVGDYYVKFDQNLKRQLLKYLNEWGKFRNIQRFLKKSEFLKEPLQTLQNLKNNYKNLYKSKLTKNRVKEIENIISSQSKNNYYALAQELLRKWESEDKNTRELWETMNNWVYNGFNETYKKLGVDFDKIYYESETFKLGKEQVFDGLEKGVFYKKEDNSVWIDLTNDGLDHKLLLRSDGTTVYMTQDIGTAIERINDYKFDEMVYVVGNEQEYHFQVLSLILDKLNFSWAKNLKHLSYGMVELPSGKMKSREGTVVDADDLMDEMISTARKMSNELGKLDGYSEPEKENIYRIIGLGALKYFILKVDPKKNMTFDPVESIDFNGNTGPFIQYTYARINSIVNIAKEVNISIPETLNNSVNLNEKELELVKLVYLFKDTLKEAGNTFNPALIANYIYELVKNYNQYYHEFTILKEPDINIRDFRIALSITIGKIIKSGMELMGIEVPERM